ncbi:MAG TPA: DNA-directed RNA polymerase subunit omega [Chitinophagales bacterium]|nr:DNA-directed RNA polymerase subunit omega [Chitinophagales bacterium]HRK25920.1 DNA-directed RNA polymerase subunit omega [Chitinophagales bacterium]
MSNKKKKQYNISPHIEARNMSVIANKTGNVYESLNVIAKRANQISVKIKEELHSKIEEFASSTDTLEEVHENKEQIEISRFYERMPHPTLLALEEFMDNKLYHRPIESAKTEEETNAKKL